MIRIVLGSVLLAGVLLLCLLPVGLLQGVTSPLYVTLFLTHFLLLIVGALTSIIFLTRLFRAEKLRLLGVWTSVIVTGIICIAWGMIPTLDAASRSHHLFLPQSWIALGVIGEIQWYEPAYLPSLYHLGLASLLQLQSNLFLPLYQFTILLSLTGVIAGTVNLITKQTSATFFATILTITLPYFLRFTATPGPQLLIALFSASALFLLIRFRDSNQLIGTVLAGVASGLATGISYRGLLWMGAAIPLLVVNEKRTLSQKLLSISLFVFSALLIFSPWMLRGMMWRGDPLFPLFYRAPKEAVELFFSIPLLGNSISAPRSVFESPFAYLTAPFRLFLSGNDFDPRYFDGVLSPLLVVSLAPLFRLKNNRGLKRIYFSILLYYILVVLTAPLEMPVLVCIIPALLVLSGSGFVSLQAYLGKKTTPILLRSFLGIHLMLTLLYVWQGASERDAFAYLRGSLTKDEFLMKHFPEQSMIAKINELVPEDSLTYLLLFPPNFVSFKSPIISESPYEAPWLGEILMKTQDDRSLSTELHQRGVKYLAANKELIESIFLAQLPAAAQMRWSKFEASSLKEIHSEKGLVLWKLSDS